MNLESITSEGIWGGVIVIALTTISLIIKGAFSLIREAIRRDYRVTIDLGGNDKKKP